MARDWVCGACMLICRKSLDEIGSFDERFFLYWEEVDWCKRAHNNNWEIHFLTNTSVKHEGGVSAKEVGPVASNGCIEKYFLTSRRRYFIKHHGILTAITVDAVHATRRIGHYIKSRLTMCESPG